MAIIFANNVRSQLTTAANSSVASLVVTAGVSPFVTPPDPSQSSGLCYLTITDNLALPTRTEVVTYTGRTGAGPFTLTGVRRGQEGTVSESWAAGATVFQSWTARPAREIQEPRVNALMNSDFRIWQRGTNQSNFTGKRWTADRWRVGLVSQGTWSARLVETQSTVPDFTAVNSLLTYRNVLTVRVADAAAPAAGDIVALQQFIEGHAYRRFARKEKVASFWVRANRTGTFGFSLQEGVSSVSFINTFRIEATGTWEQKIMRIPAHNLQLADMSTTYGAAIAIVLAAGSNFTTANSNRSAWLNAEVLATASDLTNGADTLSASYSFAAFGLYEGSDPPDFVPPDPGIEIERCKRFYQKSFRYDVSPGNGVITAHPYTRYIAGRVSTNEHEIPVKFSPHLARRSATATLYAADAAHTAVVNGQWAILSGGWDSALTSINSNNFYETGMMLTIAGSAVAGFSTVDGDWSVDADYNP